MVTVKDIAKKVGVSAMTVNRVLTNYPHVRQEKREAIRAACAELNYVPNMMASGMKSRKSHAIGVIIPTFEHSYYARFLNHVEEKCRSLGYHIINIQCHCEGGNATIGEDELRFLLARRIDGLLVVTELPETIMELLKTQALPVIFVGYCPNNGFSSIGTDDHEGGSIMTRYLLDMGHRNVAFIGGPERHYNNQWRFAGYRDTLAERHIPLDESLVVFSDFSTPGGFNAMSALLASGKKFSAVVAANDYLGIGAIAACFKNGVKVPDDISVIGFTGDSIGAFTVPPLTTVAEPIDAVAVRAVDMLMTVLGGEPATSEKVLLRPTLIERQSTRKIA